jgi:hypothetical protein
MQTPNTATLRRYATVHITNSAGLRAARSRTSAGWPDQFWGEAGQLAPELTASSAICAAVESAVGREPWLLPGRMAADQSICLGWAP